MVKVITYGTYDLLHHGHIKLLERAKALGDYLIVGVTADDFDKMRGKINVKQPLMERIEAVRATGLADEIIVEEYEGQKIDDIKRLNVDIFTVGSDWVGKFDYLNEFCKVIYLPRTEGVSSSQIRNESKKVVMGFIGDEGVSSKYRNECSYVNGIEISDSNSFDDILSSCQAVYISTLPETHYEMVKQALNKGLHVLCESPVAMTGVQVKELFDLAKAKNLVLMDAVKTAYSTAYNRLLVLVKSGIVGRVVSIESTCTSLKDLEDGQLTNKQNSMCAWGPTGMLPIFQMLGTDYKNFRVTSLFAENDKKFDLFSKIDFDYSSAVASVRIGKGVKSEGQLIISGTEGYILVPAPWWKTDYFEVRRENSENNRKYYYQLDGEGIRYELSAFRRSIEGQNISYVDYDVSYAISKVIENFNEKNGLVEINQCL